MYTMEVGKIGASQFIEQIKPLNSPDEFGKRERAVMEEGPRFQDAFDTAWNNVKDTSADYTDVQYRLSTGQLDDPHTLMIAANKAELSVSLMVQLRNKALESYDQLMRINV